MRRGAGSRRAGPAAGSMGLGVRAVFFDLDNTLIDTAQASSTATLEVTSRCPSPAPDGASASHPGRALRCSLGVLSPLCFRRARGQVIPQGPRGTGLGVFETHTSPRFPEERRRRMSGLGRLPSLQPCGLGRLPIYSWALGSWVLQVGSKRFGSRKHIIKAATVAELLTNLERPSHHAASTWPFARTGLH